MHPDLDVSRVPQALFNRLGQLPGVAIGADVGDDDRLLRKRAVRLAPFCIEVDDLAHMAVQHRAVAGQDHLDVEILDPFKRRRHVRPLEWANDAVKVVPERFQIAFLVLKGAPEDPRVAKVRTKGIAGDERLVLFEVGEHGVRPVQVGQRHERERLAAQFQPVPVLDRDALEVAVDDVLQKAQRRGRGDDLDVGVQPKEVLDGARVVGLGMADDDVVDFRNIRKARDRLHVVVQELMLCGLNQRGLLRALEHIGVVGGAVLGLHDDVEDRKARVQHAAVGQSFRQLERIHRMSSFVRNVRIHIPRLRPRVTAV